YNHRGWYMKKEIYRFLSHVTFGGLAIRYRKNNIINVPDGKNIKIKIVGENNVVNINCCYCWKSGTYC
ncbi:MAG: hypothetical protein ACLRFI_03025, partial [Alphaproteobacteria bacterium]